MTDKKTINKTSTKSSTKSFIKSPWFPIIAALLTVAIVISGVIFLPKLFAMPLNNEAHAEAEYASYRSLYEEVKNYNFAFGGDVKLEQKIKKALERSDDNVAGYFYYLLAAAEYYYNVRDYDLARNFAEEAETYSPTDTEYEELIDFFLKLFSKQGNVTAFEYWLDIYNEYHSEGSSCAEDATEEEATEETSE